jgi:hypothetical protein
MPPDASHRLADPYRLARSDAWGGAYRTGRPTMRPEGGPAEPARARDGAEVLPFRQLR